MVDSNKIVFFDTTLRDGEQSPGCSMNTAEKLEVAAALVELGVDVIEAGFPIASPGDFEAVEAIARQFGDRGPTICGLARCRDEDIDRAGTHIPQKTLGHLATRRVAGAEDENACGHESLDSAAATRGEPA